MRRRTLITTNREGIKGSKAVAGDVCLYNNISEEVVIIPYDEYSADTYPDTNYSPVGVVVVPGTHNVYGTGECGVMSIVPMNCSTPTTGGSEMQQMHWGNYTYAIEGMNDHQTMCYVGKGTSFVSDNKSYMGTYTYPKMPSDKFSVVQSPFDSDVYYSSSIDYQAPSPYNTDETRNEVYKINDFNGRKNTDLIIEARGEKDYSTWLPTYNRESDYPAASCCDMYYTDGTEQGDWYLPACGELGYVLVKYKKINRTISTLKTLYGVGVKIGSGDTLWSSTRYSSTNIRTINMYDGYVYSLGSSYWVSYTYSFLRLK